MPDKKAVYQSNIQILYTDLSKAIQNYKNDGYRRGDVQFINAYLMATVGAIAAYCDTNMPKGNETNEIKACKYANNMLKHDPTVVTFVQAEGGFQLPMSFPISIPAIDIVWKWQDLYSKHTDQKQAFKTVFGGKPVLETLEGVLSQLGIAALKSN